MKTKLVWVLACVALAACGDDDRPVIMTDSGPGVDGGGPRDGGPVDGGVRPDGGDTDAGGMEETDGGSMTPDGGGGPASCTDGSRNGDETGVDCGGPTCTARCADDARCEISSDCTSGVCIGRICIAASCTDGIRNGDETGRDCGGPCGGCGLGEACAGMGDCATGGSCVGGFCVAAHCTNATRDSDETDVDCGGGECGPCMSGEGCMSDADCTDSTCIESYCRSTSCTNGTMDGGEVGVDCGGECPGCDDGASCTVPADCLSNRCEAGTCTSCSDRMRNGDETDVDCGGSECGPCSGGLMCSTGDDCFAGTCMAGVCTGPRIFYFEGFESGPGGWTTGGTASSWQHGVPSGSVIQRAYEGTRAWVTNLTGQYPNNESSWIQSPAIDLSGVTTDPVVSFGLIFETESCCDEGWLEVSINGGTTWTKVGAQNTGVNWYNQSSNEWKNTNGGWTRASHVLTGTAGQSDVRLRFRFSSDISVTREGFGVDSVSIRESFPADLRVTIAPDLAVCGRLVATVTNEGEATSGNFRLRTMIDGTNAQENFPSGLPAGATVTRNIDGSAASSVTVFADYAMDPTPGNNTATVMPSSSFVRLGAAGYREGFEANDGGWTQTGTNSTWAWGTPSATYITAAGEGTRAWVTNPAGVYRSSETSYLVSPCFDATAITTDLGLRMLHTFETEGAFDEGWVEMSVDGGATWTKVVAGPSAMNWYNDTSNVWWDGNSGGGWRTAITTLPGSAGQRRLRLRHVFSSDSSGNEDGFGVDDVQLRPLAVDLAVSVRSSVTACGAFEAVITNVGDAAASSTAVTFRVDGGAAMMRTVSATIAPGASVVEPLGVTGTSIEVSLTTAGDANPGNDSASAMASIALGAGYSTSFEASPGGWQSTGTNSSWAWGTPAGAYITAAASGTRAWVTNLTGNYNMSEASYLVSPCFDLRGVASASVTFAHIYRTQNNQDSGWIEISLDGGTTWSKLGTSGTGSSWYNDAGRDVWDDQGPVSGAWLEASHPLTGAGGNAQVRLRHAFTSDATTAFEGFGVDDVRIAP
ncbi:MAG: immune inhibitor A [Sandaracinus sp.]|nr:immune inhibitor A [Sandaracinus sp.]